MPDPVERPSKHLTVVSAPGLKLAIGFIASLCAVFSPRLIAALSVPDHADITFISAEYAELALAFSLLIGLVVAILEWRVPRTPRDTFMTTLGVPAILAGALTANQGAAELQRTSQSLDSTVNAMLQNNGIPVETPAASGAASEGASSLLRVPFVATVYAQAATAAPVMTPAASRLAIVINQPRYFVVLDRATTAADAQARLSALTKSLNAAAPGRAPKVELRTQSGAFLIVLSGGPLAKADAAVQAVNVKNTYRLSPTLVQALS
jgi:hypothetical protein